MMLRPLSRTEGKIIADGPFELEWRLMWHRGLESLFLWQRNPHQMPSQPKRAHSELAFTFV